MSSRRPSSPSASRSAVDAAGLREYYDPFTGAGMGAVDFGWSTLVLELLDPDPRARLSYLGAQALT